MQATLFWRLVVTPSRTSCTRSRPPCAKGGSRSGPSVLWGRCCPWQTTSGAVAVEFAIGRCFNDFLVSSTRDLDVLKVTTSKLTPHNPYTTWWRAGRFYTCCDGEKQRCMQDLMRQCGLPKAKFPTVSIVTFGLPKHNLGQQASAAWRPGHHLACAPAAGGQHGGQCRFQPSGRLAAR